MQVTCSSNSYSATSTTGRVVAPMIDGSALQMVIAYQTGVVAVLSSSGAVVSSNTPTGYGVAIDALTVVSNATALGASFASPSLFAMELISGYTTVTSLDYCSLDASSAYKQAASNTNGIALFTAFTVGHIMRYTSAGFTTTLLPFLGSQTISCVIRRDDTQTFFLGDLVGNIYEVDENLRLLKSSSAIGSDYVGLPGGSTGQAQVLDMAYDAGILLVSTNNGMLTKIHWQTGKVNSRRFIGDGALTLSNCASGWVLASPGPGSPYPNPLPVYAFQLAQNDNCYLRNDNYQGYNLIFFGTGGNPVKGIGIYPGQSPSGAGIGVSAAISSNTSISTAAFLPINMSFTGRVNINVPSGIIDKGVNYEGFLHRVAEIDGIPYVYLSSHVGPGVENMRAPANAAITDFYSYKSGVNRVGQVCRYTT